ncbi:unnamed protein product [Moneuplotes crassus]|uniref:Uncharacterized protein n=1 Tax=Euplotes crassus TaxID=5936 RepID=A0AAD1XEU1_EUPCR|nr:unnamed protein product [Moneuplotes crassus]
MGNCCTSNDKNQGGYGANPPVNKKVQMKRMVTTTQDTDRSSSALSSDYSPDKSIDKRSSTYKAASLESFNTLKVIGRGSYGKVFMVEEKTTGKVFAMKVLKKGAITDERGKERVLTERDIIMQIRHPYIVTLHYSFQTKKKLFFILDFLNGGDLYTHIMNYGKFNENRARFYTAELVLAINHLHKKGIVYRDLKPQNIMLDSEGHIKLTDFGLSKADFSQDQSHTICGTIKYIAPETISGMSYNHTVDWWSMGIILYRMLTGKLPYPTNKNSEVRVYIVHNKIQVSKKRIPDETARSFILGLLERDPTMRLGANGVEDIKNHEYFETIDWDALERREVKPPYNPRLKSEKDVKHIDSKYLDENIVSCTLDDNDLKKGNMNNQMFEDFTYTKEDPMSKKGRQTEC